MRICVVSDIAFPSYGGISVASKRVCAELAKKRKIVLITGDKTQDELVPKNIKVYKFRSVGVPFTKKISNLPFASKKEIKDILKQEKIDVVHLFAPYSPLGFPALQAAKKLRLPVYATHNFQAENITKSLPLKMKYENLNNGLYKTFNKSLDQCDIVQCATKFAKKLYRSTGGKANVVVLSNGIDIKKFKSRDNPEIRKLRKKLAKNNEKIILYAGRLMKEKNIKVLIKAFNLYAKKNPEAKLVIVGKGVEEKRLKRLAKKLEINKKVIFTGFVKEQTLPKIYSAADLFVLPSLVELQSLVTLEAMASSLPVIVAKSELSAAPGLVKKGKNGFLFKPDSPQGLAKKIHLILKDKKRMESFGGESRKIAEQHDINKIIKELVKNYKKLIKNKKFISFS